MNLLKPKIGKSNQKGIVVGIDASRNRSGGAIGHLIGLIDKGDPLAHGIRQVHLWAYKSLLDEVSNQKWLVKHQPPALGGSLVRQVIWQIFQLPKEARNAGCEIILNTDAGTMSKISPSVTMSRDMLSYEPGEMRRYGVSMARLRLILLRHVQNRSLRRADGVIFLSNHAAKMIQKNCGRLPNVKLIPHGVSEIFKNLNQSVPWPRTGERPIRVLYISNAAWYKHQWMVIRAVEQLRKRGINLNLILVGGGKGPAQKKIQNQLAISDPQRNFVTQKGFVPRSELPGYLLQSDIFVFASTCENMPNTLLEAMAAGLPIACSRRGPMPEILKDAGEYFDPESLESIIEAIHKLIHSPGLRQRLALRAKRLAAGYSWERCANETWSFLSKTVKLTKA